MKQLIQRNYETTCKRGKITSLTKDYEFTDKIQEELNELRLELTHSNFDNAMIELADVVLVCLNFAYHKDVDLIKIMNEKINYNDKRPD